MILNINKPIGITSYDVIRLLKKHYPGEKIGHAGTLDPLAEGVLICLTGKDTKLQSEFMGASKEYEFEILFGFETDTYDVLGISKDFIEYDPKEIEQKVKDLVPYYKGSIEQTVPRFSAVKIDGVPLYRKTISNQRTLDKTIYDADADLSAVSKDALPVRTVQVDSLDVLESEVISKAAVLEKVLYLVSTVKMGFRQEEITARWQELIASVNQDQFLLMRFRTQVSKGTYVRAIAHDIGQDLKIGACTTTIKRTRVGDHKIEDSINV